MSAFVDETRFEVFSGDGGGGSTSFRREKYVPRGGPDGGDGGKGGDVIFETRRALATLAHLRGKHILKAGRGENGKGRRMHGKNGEDLIIQVPPGTRIINNEDNSILHDFQADIEGERWTCLTGGIGGLGNWHFRSSRNQKPMYAQEGKPGESLNVSLELMLIGDIGLVGLPSAGKSSLINAITAANSKVGAYPFTTKVPHLGVLRKGESEVVIADIPGLIEGAADGAGLGHKFLRHIGRAASLAFLTDLGEDDPSKAVHALSDELRAYDESLLDKRRIIIGTKTDLDEDGSRLEQLLKDFPDDTVLGVSVYERTGLDELIDAFILRGNRPTVKTAILGGSFNPVHRGHLNLADSVLNSTSYDRVLFVPAGIPPHKELSSGADDAQRLEMLRLALEGRAGMSIWDGEIRRPGKSFTIDTVRELRESGIVSGRPGLVIGDDLLDGFHMWRHVTKLVREVEIIVARRGSGDTDGGSGELPFSPLLLDNDVWPYSSTVVRNLVSSGSDISGILPPAVARYIRENHLYGHNR